MSVTAHGRRGVLNTTPLKIKEGVILGPILLCINLTYFLRKVTYKLIDQEIILALLGT